MRYADLRDAAYERSGLLDKKRLGKRQKARLAELDDMLNTQPPPTPPREPTGERGDYLGNVYAMHSAPHMTLRELRRTKRFGRSGIQPMRSRIQRLTRKRRTGGVR